MYWISSGSAIGDDLQESRKGLWKSFPLPQPTLSKLPCWASLGWNMVNSHWKPPKPEVLRAPRSAAFFPTGGSSSWDTSASIRPVETIKLAAFFNSLTTGSFSAPFEVWRSCEDCTAAGNSGLRYVSWWWRMSYLVWLSGIQRHFLRFLRSKHEVIKGIFAHLFGSKDMTEYWDAHVPRNWMSPVSLGPFTGGFIGCCYCGTLHWHTVSQLSLPERMWETPVPGGAFYQFFANLFFSFFRYRVYMYMINPYFEEMIQLGNHRPRLNFDDYW